MSLSQSLLPEFDQEMANTRKMLERVPEDRFDWKPHVKSRSMGQLANHIAIIPALGNLVLTTESLDMAQAGEPPPAETVPALLERFDEHTAACRASLRGVADDDLMVPWSMVDGGSTLMTLPRAGALRTLLFSHIIHHRAQLGVYLRLSDVPVPGMYGPSGDEA